MATGDEHVPERNPFAVDLFNYVWNKLGYAIGEIPNTMESYFCEEIGDAVVCMMVWTRECLLGTMRHIFIRTEDDAVNVTRKLCKCRRYFPGLDPPDYCQLFIELCSIIAEVHLYCRIGREFPFDDNMVFKAWNLVMNRRFMEKVMAEGGWSALTAHARLRFGEVSRTIYESYDYSNHGYQELLTDAFIGANVLARSYQITFEHMTKSKTDFKEGARCLAEQARISRRISALQADLARAEEELAKLALSSQLRTQIKKLQRAKESTDWTEEKLMECIKPVSPYNSSEEDDSEEDVALVMEICRKTSDDFFAASGIIRKKKNKKRKKKKSKKELPVDEAGDDLATTTASFQSSDRPLRLPGANSASISKADASPTEVKTDKATDVPLHETQVSDSKKQKITQKNIVKATAKSPAKASEDHQKEMAMSASKPKPAPKSPKADPPKADCPPPKADCPHPKADCPPPVKADCPPPPKADCPPPPKADASSTSSKKSRKKK